MYAHHPCEGKLTDILLLNMKMGVKVVLLDLDDCDMDDAEEDNGTMDIDTAYNR